MFFAGIAASVVMLFHFSRDLPSISALDTLQRPPQISIYDRHGDLITVHGDEYGDPVTIEELPDHVVEAFLATEDRNFYHHIGVNPFSIIRALIINIRTGEVRQGGSTITQQFVKNALLSSEKRMKRKIQEMLLALQIEAAFSKDEILALYLNNVYFGSGTWGLRAASLRYFDKPPSALTVGEAAILAGLLKAPTRYSPAANPEGARARARTVLAAMVDAGYLSREEADRIVLSDIKPVRKKFVPAPYAVSYVLQDYETRFGKAREDIRIHTTLDLRAHEIFQQKIETVFHEQPVLTGNEQVAAVSLGQDGAILLMTGGRHYEASSYNRAVQASRQPGSAFKPFVYLAAAENGWLPTDLVEDTPVVFHDWTPANYKDKYYGVVPLQEALARSLNAAAIRLQEEVGRGKVKRLVRRLGFTGAIDPGPAMALGVNAMTPMELAALYQPFANNGIPAQPYVISAVYDKNGKVLYAYDMPKTERIVSTEALTILNHLLRGVVATGSGRRAALPGYAAYGKTGTTQDSRDAWFAGHAAGVTGVVWTGKDDNRPMTGSAGAVNGSGPPALLWKELMVAVLDGRPDEPQPEWMPPPPPVLEEEVLSQEDDLGLLMLSAGAVSSSGRDDGAIVIDEIEAVLEQPTAEPDIAAVDPVIRPSTNGYTSMDGLLREVAGNSESIPGDGAMITDPFTVPQSDTQNGAVSAHLDNGSTP